MVKNMDKMLDMLQAEKIERKNASKIQAALHAFVSRPKTEIAKLQATGVSTDLPVMTTDRFNVTIESDNFDMGWEASFKQVPLEKSRDFWEIANAANTLTFYKVKEGHKIEVAGVSGTRAIAKVDKYGGAIGWTDEMVRFRKLALMIDRATIFRNEFWTKKADVHYALLAQSGATQAATAWQGVATDSRTTRDILTINKAAFDLTDRLKDKGYGNMASAPLIMYANPFDEDRIEAAFRVTSNALVSGSQNGQQVTSRRIRRIYTYNSSIVSGSPLLVLPGVKIQKADAMQPTVFNQEVDILSLNRVQAVWAYYGATVADTEQCQNLTLG